MGGYNVNRCAGAGCTPAYHDWVASGTTYTDSAVTSGTLYRYSVSAYFSTSNTTSDLSNVVEETAGGGTGPGIPTNFRASTGAEGIVLRWSRPSSGQVDGYNIYRCVGAGCSPVWFGNPDPATASSYTDRAVTKGTTYRYAVNVYLNDRTQGDWSEEIEVTATETPRALPPKPPKPAGLRARGGDRIVILSWDDPNNRYISLYQYRKKAAGGEYGNWTDISGSGASTTTYTATGLKNGTEYTFMIRALNAEGYVSESYEVTATPTANPLGVPEGLTATPISNGIVLRWSRPSSGPVDGYNIYRCAGAGCDPIWFANPDPASANSYTDRAVTTDTTYRYAVAVYLDDRTRGEWSEVVTATATDTSAGGVETVVPSDLTATAGAEGIVLNWTAPATTSDTVGGHNVNRCEGADCTPVYHDWVPSGTTYTDGAVTDGALYRYSVSAFFNVSDTTSDWSNVVEETAEGGTGPGIPTGLTATADAEGIVLHWTAPADEVDGYNVYRCAGAACDPEWIVSVAPATITTYTDLDVTTDTSYRYAVGAYLDDGTRSDWSEVVETMAAETPAPEVMGPGIPAGLTATADAEGVVLRWTAPAGTVDGYNVYRCAGAACDPEWIASVAPGTITTYTDRDVTADTSYRYAVDAYLDDGTRGDWSEVVETMAAETPAPEVMGPGIPAGLTAMADAEGVVLRWTAPAGVVDGYNVYRCAGAVCDPEWIASVTSGTTYLDDGSADPDDDGTPIGLTPNTNYRYAVAAYLDDGAQGDWSEVVDVTSAAAPATLPPGLEDERREVLKQGMAAFGRTLAADAVEVFGERFGALPTATATSATVAGRKLDPAASPSLTEALMLTAKRLSLPMPNSAGENLMLTGISNNPAISTRSGIDTHTSGFSAWPGGSSGELSLKQAATRLLSQSDFQVAMGESDDDGISAWTLWGRSSVGGFEGGRSEHDLLLDGEVISGYLGLDYQWSANTLLGIAVSHSVGEMDYETDITDEGELETELTSVYQYAHWSPRADLGLWGVLGYGFGKGGLELSDSEVTDLETDLEMWLSAVGLRNELLTLGSIDLALKADAFSIWMEAEAVEALLPSVQANSSRARLMLEGQTNWTLSEYSLLTPSLEAGVRWDDGDAETGLGAELGGELLYTNTRLDLSIKASGRYLVTHELADYEEWGASLTASIGPGGGEGLTISLAPVWGNLTGGADTLWGDKATLHNGGASMMSSAPLPRDSSWQPSRMELKFRYGIGISQGLLTPFGELGMAGANSYRLRFGTAMDARSGWQWRLFGEYGEQLRQHGVTDAEYRVGLTVTYDFDEVRKLGF